MARSICLVALALFACAAVVSAQDVDIEEDVSASLQRNNGACSATSVSAAIAAALANTDTLSNFRLLVVAAGDDLGTQRPKEAKWTIFAPVNAAAGTAGGLTDAERDTLLGANNRATLLQVVRRHIATGGALPTKALEKRNNAVLATAQTGPPAVTLSVVVTRTPGATPPTTIAIQGPTNRVNVINPTNTHACKSVVHAVSAIIAAP